MADKMAGVKEEIAQLKNDVDKLMKERNKDNSSCESVHLALFQVGHK